MTVKGRSPGRAVPTGHMSMSGGMTAEHLGHMLEGILGALVVDETKTPGSFNVTIKSEGGTEGLLRALQQETGIAVTRERRDVEFHTIVTAE